MIIIICFNIYIYTRNRFLNYGSKNKGLMSNHVRMWPMLPAEYKLSIDEINKLQLKYKNEKLKKLKSKDGNQQVQEPVVKKC